MTLALDLPSRDTLSRWLPSEVLDSLSRRLARGRRVAHDDVLAAALDQPLGAISRELATGDAGSGFWARLSPVSLVADLNGVGLVGLPDLRAEETKALTRLVAEACQGQGWTIEPDPEGGLWLRSDQDPAIQAVPPQRALGHDIHAFQPVGKGARAWRACSGEIEIGLHHAAFNRARAERGERTINGVWIWGCGALPPPSQAPITLYGGGRWQHLAGQWAGWTVVDLSPPRRFPKGRHCIVDLRSIQDPDCIMTWLDALPGWLGQRPIVALEEEPAVQLSHWDSWAFWRPAGADS